jgi:4-hydroxysphinganine ceramide fatty acyl 2-hydroxylase
MTKTDYIQFVNDPKHLIHPPRDVFMFDIPFLERFSKTSWYIIPLLWLPVVVGLFYLSELSLLGNIIMLPFGITFWSLLEYSLHRFLFHCEEKLPDKGAFLYFHFLIHGIHHAFPMDK